MVLGILTSIAACPAIIGTTEAVRQGQKQNSREKHRSRKANLLVTCSDPSRKARDIHGGTVVLKNDKVGSHFPLLDPEPLLTQNLAICHNSQSESKISRRLRNSL